MKKLKLFSLFLALVFAVSMFGWMTPVTVEAASTVKNGIVEDTDGIRYYVNGTYQIGWQKIDGNDVYFFAATGLMCDYDRTIGGVYTEFETFDYNGLTLYRKKAAVKNGLVEESDGIRYYVNGTYQIGWQTIDGNALYFFAATGLMCDYDRTIGGVYTEFETFDYNGLTLYRKKANVKNGFIEESDGIRYYVNGKYHTGWLNVDGNALYFFAATGLMCDYDRAIGGVYTEFEPFDYNGMTLYRKVTLKNGLIAEGIRYYIDGEYQTGWQKFGNYDVYFSPETGYMCDTDSVIDGVYVEFEAVTYGGMTLYSKIKNGIVEDTDGIRYYIDGKYQTGWQTIGGYEVYFFAATGLMCDYDRTIGGVYTEFEPFSYNGLTLYRKKLDLNFSEGLAYTLSEDGTYYIVSGMGDCTDTELVIPYTYNGLPVQEIGENAFVHNRNLTSVVIPGNVLRIGGWSFMGCENLVSVQILNGVEIIDHQSFSWCLGLENITIPESVTSILPTTFWGCDSMKEFSVSADNAYYKSVDGVLYTKDGTSLMAYPAGKTAEEFVIPDGVESIGQYAFYNCRNLTSVSIPDSVRYINYSAFEGCTSLTSISIPAGVRSIDESAFAGCTGLTEISVSESNENYKSVDGVLYTKNKTILHSYPAGKTETTFTIPDGVVRIYSNAFCGAENLVSVEIPESVTSMGRAAFYGCTSLTDIVIPSSVTDIGGWVFEGCTSLKSVVLPESMTEIPSGMFSRCTSLTDVVIPSGVTSIGSSAFEDCTSLADITIPSGVTSIGGYAFAWCESLTSIDLPEGITSIAQSTFYGCISLTDVVIPSGVTSIGSNAFAWCESLTSIELPENVTSIGRWTFYRCTNLATIRYAGTVSQWDEIALSSGWKFDVPATSVVCSDGEVALS